MTIDEAGKEKRLNEGINDYLHCHRQLHYHSISGVCTTYLLVTAARCGELASTEPAAAPWDPREEVEDHERDEAEGGAAPRERRRRGDIDARRDLRGHTYSPRTGAPAGTWKCSKVSGILWQTR